MKNLLIATMLGLFAMSNSYADFGAYENIGSQAQRKQIVLKVNKKFKGINLIKLKRLAKAQYPNLNLQKLKLKAVKIFAKSKKGKGEATLLVNQMASYPEAIPGNPIFFHFNKPFTFSKLRIKNPSRNSNGKWQIELRGNIKVKKVVLIVQKKGRQMPPRRGGRG